MIWEVRQASKHKAHGACGRDEYYGHAGSQTSWQIASMTAAEAVAQLCARKMTALQYAEAVLEVAETYSCLNAFSFLEKDKVNISSTSSSCAP